MRTNDGRDDHGYVGDPAYFAEYDGIVDDDYSAETGNTHYGWWGKLSETGLSEVKLMIDEHQPTARLRYIPIQNVREEQSGAWTCVTPDWDNATVYPKGTEYIEYPHPDVLEKEDDNGNA